MKKFDDKKIIQLYRDVANYVESRGGRVVIIGGIEIQEWQDYRDCFTSLEDGCRLIIFRINNKKPLKSKKTPRVK